MRQSILGYNVVSVSAADCVSEVALRLAVGPRDCAWLACINPHSYAVARTDLEFKRALHAANWLVPDGIGVVIAGRVLQRELSERITGFDIFDGVMRELDQIGGRVFFLGSSEENLALIEARIAEDYPRIVWAGGYSPPYKPVFTDADNAEMLCRINAARVDVLWVGMTAPKQEKWITAHRAELDVKFAGAIGAVFDFYTGKIIRSNPAFQKLGLEWLPRLVQEPRRLWRRMFVSAPIFMRDVLFARLRGNG